MNYTKLPGYKFINIHRTEGRGEGATQKEVIFLGYMNVQK